MKGSSYNKGIAKFALFLVAGNLINLVGQAVVALMCMSLNLLVCTCPTLLV